MERSLEPVITSNGKLALQIPSGASISQVYDPQSVLANHTVEATAFNAQIKGEPGRQVFILIYIGDGSIQLPVKINHPAFFGTDICKVCIGGGFPDVLYIDINRLPQSISP